MKKILPIILVLLMASNAFALSELLKTVEEDGNGDYTSLEACMNGNEQNLVTADKYFTVKICGTDLGDGGWGAADTTADTIHNYTTDATRYINIYTTATARHKGIWSTSYYILSSTSGYCISASSGENIYLKIKGLQLLGSPTTGSFDFFIHSTTSDGTIEISYCILKYAGSTTSQVDGFKVWRLYNGGFYIFNNIVYGLTGSGSCYAMEAYNTTVYAYSNTVYGCKTGLWDESGTAIRAKNNICYNNVVKDYLGTFNAASTNNLSKDGTAPPLNTFYINKTLTFTNTSAGTEDFHLVSTDTDAIDKGTNTSGESAPLNFTDDIDGVIRSGTWDIGADEYVAAGGGFGQVIIISD